MGIKKWSTCGWFSWSDLHGGAFLELGLDTDQRVGYEEKREQFTREWRELDKGTRQECPRASLWHPTYSGHKRIGRVGKHGLEGVPLDGCPIYSHGRLLWVGMTLRDVQVQWFLSNCFGVCFHFPQCIWWTASTYSTPHPAAVPLPALARFSSTQEKKMNI